ncbi:MAG TPA: 2-phospho-L-lactate transferase CofD family protein [Thermoleophilaceae bacterium]|nr:2-phospho-L-lactate transferase CofD family protein [Thermoleophilaceae bacterium]
MVVVLAGGTGGAKLARGMLDVVGPDELVVVANTGDDSEHYGVHVSPDPDLVTYWLADVIDERGWGIDGDTWTEMERRRAAGEEIWFNLGDRDLEFCRLRTERMAAGARVTQAHAAVGEALGVRARVLPMADEPVRTWVKARGDWHPFQEFMIKLRGAEPEAVELRGIDDASITPEVADALAAADAIVIGPSNPVISIGPILAVAGMREALAASRAPVVAVSPFVHGDVLKGPTAAFCRMAALGLATAAVEKAYAGLIDGVVTDAPGELPALQTDVLMDSREARERVAADALRFARSLA